ncbi:MAG: AAA family ATPase [Bdellovibrionales bacterium]|nr:AAA family ATPase [Bdellovibrionales bacterium]
MTTEIANHEDSFCRPLNEFEAKEIDWLWSGRVPTGCISLLEGDGGTGKSFVIAAIASAISTGNALPDDDTHREPANVLLLAAEDDPSVVLRPRFESQGGDLSRVFLYEEPLTLDDHGIKRIRALILKHDPKLIAIDPIVSFLGTKIDTSSATDVRAVLKPLAALAAEFQLAVLIVRHWNKSALASASMRGSGSVDFRNASRSALSVISTDEGHYIAISKSNYGATGKTLTFTIENRKLLWTGHSDLSADEILNRARLNREQPSEIDVAKEFLITALADGPVPALRLIDDAVSVGVSKRTLFRAKSTMNVASRKNGPSWDWTLPDTPIPGENVLKHN